MGSDDELPAVVATTGDDDCPADDLLAASTTYLMSPDGSEQCRVVALEFDGPSLVQRCINDGLNPDYMGDPREASHVLIVAVDGGPVCRRTLTVVTVTLSDEILLERQSPLMPMVHLLSGESALHSGVGRQLRFVIKDLMDAEFTVPWRSPHGHPVPGDLLPREIVAVRAPRCLHVVGDFLMQHDILGLTGGADDWRCPTAWPCKSLMSPSAPS